MTSDHVVSRNEGIGEHEALPAPENGLTRLRDADCKCAISSQRGARAPVGSWLGLGAGLAAVFAPKCPMCLAAYLSVLGIGVGLTEVAPMLLPLGIGVASIAFISLLKSRRGSTEEERKRR